MFNLVKIDSDTKFWRTTWSPSKLCHPKKRIPFPYYLSLSVYFTVYHWGKKKKKKEKIETLFFGLFWKALHTREKGAIEKLKYWWNTPKKLHDIILHGSWGQQQHKFFTTTNSENHCGKKPFWIQTLRAECQGLAQVFSLWSFSSHHSHIYIVLIMSCSCIESY